MAERLAPSISPDTAFFWEGVAAHRLLIQRCVECGHLRHPPRPMCPVCSALGWDTIESTGRGRVISYVLPRHPIYSGYEDATIVALVELDEGVRLVTNLRDVEADHDLFDLVVEVVYEAFEGGLTLPQVRPAGSR
ncbi:MAG: zinc ribbon domain-containing protein [Acidimicrobiales bacterium]